MQMEAVFAAKSPVTTVMRAGWTLGPDYCNAAGQLLQKHNYPNTREGCTAALIQLTGWRVEWTQPVCAEEHQHMGHTQ